MARRLTFEEAQTLETAPGQDVAVSPEEIIRLLMEQRDAMLELTPESQSWFGDVDGSRR